MALPTVNEHKRQIMEKVTELTGKAITEATNKDFFDAITAIVNERIAQNWQATNKKYEQKGTKQVYYVSMEFLVGSLLASNLLNEGLLDITEKALVELERHAENVFAEEHDAGLGNGGLGRLAACFLDSLASLHFAGHGYGIRYRYGLFEQRIIHGNQIELPDHWLRDPYPWETRKEAEKIRIHFGGEVQMLPQNDGSLEIKQLHTDDVFAVPYDIPIVGYKNEVVNTLRLWSAEPIIGSDDRIEDNQTYYHELDHNYSMEQISEFLYPDDSKYEGKELRLKQQYFLVSASLQHIISNYKKGQPQSLTRLYEKVAIQINDTHPSLAIPELMRLLLDKEKFGWEQAWEITTKVIAYTNHTTLSEAFEKWPIEMMKRLMPRIYMIVDEINERFCRHIWEHHETLRHQIYDMAIIADEHVHMARLAIVGSFSVNGVAALHTEILKTQVMKNFHTIFPERFNNKTNGITHRRWLLQANPGLSNCITSIIGPQWIQRPKQLINLLKHTNDQDFLENINKVKLKNKRQLAAFIYERTGIVVDETSIFDVQIKRLHAYKRQLLKVFHIMYLYQELKENPHLDITPRTFIFGAKAAPSYHLAKEVIKLIHKVASIVNHDESIQDKLKVIFMENYNVSLAEKIIPAADISEQISTAGKEASGTGNMKMMMNGAITVGTMDGANVEINDAVGKQNIFIFGLTADDVRHYNDYGGYHAMDLYHADDRIKHILDHLHDGFGSDEQAFKAIYYHILYHNDPYFVLKDFDSYVETQELVDQAYRNPSRWLKMSATNIAYAGKFSSDQTIQAYAAKIWKIKPVED